MWIAHGNVDAISRRPVAFKRLVHPIEDSEFVNTRQEFIDLITIQGEMVALTTHDSSPGE